MNRTCGHLVLASALTLALAGCTRYQARPIDPAASAAAFGERSLHASGLQAFLHRQLPASTAASSTWNVRSLTWVAFYYQPELDVARAKWRSAEAAAITAGARPNPTLDFTNQYNVDASNGASPWTVGPAFSIPIETAGKRSARILQARYLAEAARLNVADTAWQIRQRVRTALLGMYPIEPLIRAEGAHQAELVDLIQRRLREGEASQPDLTQARIASSRLSLAGQDAQRRLAESRAQLAAALGLPLNALDQASFSFDIFEHLPSPSELPLHGVQQQALLNRPDVRAALADYEASQAALQLEIAKQYPDITLGPGVLWDAGEAKWSLGLSLVLPLLNRNQGPIAEAKAHRQEAAARFLAVQAKAIGEVEQALADYRHTAQMLSTADALLASQRRAAASAQVLYNAGETDRLDWVGAQVELAAAELARTETLVQAQQALGALEDALRQPLDTGPLDLEAAESAPRKQDTEQ